MTSKTTSTPLRIVRLGRAFSLTRAVSQGQELENFITQDKWP